MAVASFEDELVRRFIEALRDSWSDAEEVNFLASGTTLNLKAQSDNEFRVDNVVAYVGVATPANGGLIILGDADKPHQIPIPGGSVQAFDTRIRLKNTSIRQLSSVVMTNNSPGAAGGGPAGWLYLALFGKEIPLGAVKW